MASARLETLFAGQGQQARMKRYRCDSRSVQSAVVADCLDSNHAVTFLGILRTSYRLSIDATHVHYLRRNSHDLSSSLQYQDLGQEKLPRFIMLLGIQIILFRTCTCCSCSVNQQTKKQRTKRWFATNEGTERAGDGCDPRNSTHQHLSI